MANERTFLAWVRTALGFITLCIGFLQFYRMETKPNYAIVNGIEYRIKNEDSEFFLRAGKVTSILCALIALVAVVFGSIRFYRIQSLLTDGQYPATRISIGVLMISAVTIFILLIILDAKVTK